MTTPTAPKLLLDRLAGYRAEVEALLPGAEERSRQVTMLLEYRDYERASEQAALLSDDLRRLRRLSRDAAGLARAMESAEEGAG